MSRLTLVQDYNYVDRKGKKWYIQLYWDCDQFGYMIKVDDHLLETHTTTQESALFDAGFYIGTYYNETL
jgi:spermidine synthase